MVEDFADHQRVTAQLEPDPNCPSCASLANELSALRAVVEKLSGEVDRLKARKPKTSRTSSKPPSTDAPWAKSASTKKSTGRKRGGQPSHKGAQRKPAPPKDVDEVLAEIRGEANRRRHLEGSNPGTHSAVKGWVDARAMQSAWGGRKFGLCTTVVDITTPRLEALSVESRAHHHRPSPYGQGHIAGGYG